MYAARYEDNVRATQTGTSDLDTDGGIIDDADDVDVDVDVDVVVDEVVATQKPHFLDYDAVPPPEFEESFDCALSFGIGAQPHSAENVSNKLQQQQQLAELANAADGELRKLEYKKYERDGEISDYELAASGYTKKEFTQDDNTLHMHLQTRTHMHMPGGNGGSTKQAFKSRPKHFLDENPIPPDYMLEQGEMREHRSLDRNFERQHVQSEQQRVASPPTSLGSGGGLRKTSLDRGSAGSAGTRTSRDRFREPSYTLSRFLDSDAQLIGSPISLPPQQRLPTAAAWTDSFDSRYGSLQLPASVELDALGPKVECVYSLLSMLGSNDPLEMSKKFLELSRTPETCGALRRSGCIPLLVQMMHSEGEEKVRKWAGMALHNVVHSNGDEKAGRREAKVLRLLDQIMDYCNFLKTLLQSGGEAIADDSDRHPLAAISSLMKVSFDEEHRHAMCELGALQAIPSLVHLDHAVHGPKPEDQCCNSLRRYALMALTNLTFGDENNKALLCGQKLFMEALVSQLDSAPDDLLQVTASVLRNLSWRADSNMKAVLNEIGTVTALARAAMKNKSENTLKAILSALWNLSAHCSTNKAEFCAVDGALAFLVDMLTYEGPSKTLKIIENAGGILRNVSSHIAVREHYRQILRERNCLAILLQQLKSESLTVVSNSCGTLWNLSARCPEDQKFLWDNGAVPMLRSLINSKHAMISEGSSSALKNLLNFRPSIQNQNQLDPIARSMGLKKLPTLNARKQKALEQELGEKVHAETCDNLDVATGGIAKERAINFETTTLYSQQRRYPLAANGVLGPPAAARLTRSAMLTKSESRGSVLSAKSDSAYENLMRSHSASDANRCSSTKSQNLPYAAVHMPRRAAYALEHDVEPTEEQPIDYSVKYNENSAKTLDDTADNAANEEDTAVDSKYATYQETDLDQPTDFSLRYAENQIESDIDISPPEQARGTAVNGVTGALTLPAASQHVKPVGGSNEILLILEDSVKCYQTEDTPYVISNAASVTDLRQSKLDIAPTVETVKPAPTKKYHKTVPHQSSAGATYGSGSYTPEKPVNYCEEGTPGYFSRYESLSSLDDSPPQATAAQSDNDKDKEQRKQPAAAPAVNAAAVEPLKTATTCDKPAVVAEDATTTDTQLSKQVDVAAPALISGGTSLNSAQETPLMFSRHSSMDSLVEEDVGPCDDKSSVVSDFSRLASGVISPSEIPDSPTQSMPQSPRRNSAVGEPSAFSATVSPLGARGGASAAGSMRGSEVKRPLRSVFEDNLNAFHVENTPAQFSCATSLSNLSILDEESNSSENPERAQQKQPEHATQATSARKEPEQLSSLQDAAVSEGEEEECIANNDDLLLASCINMGMNRITPKNNSKCVNGKIATRDEPRPYFTEDTPALLSKVGSNTNLSAISICSSINELKDDADADADLEVAAESASANSSNRNSLQLNAGDVSSNASENGVATGQTSDLLQQCIRDGMQKPQPNHAALLKARTKISTDPIAMLRRGGSALPPYLPVSDEMGKYLVEDSPCNFSTMSGLSNLTVGSSLVGPAVQLKESASTLVDCQTAEVAPAIGSDLASPRRRDAQEDVRRDLHWQDDSLSSLSIDSEDDTNLLSQAIAAGCNRPKSNLGFSTNTNTSTSKRSTSLSASQPIPINAASSASSLNSRATARHYQRHQHQMPHDSKHASNGNESYSSVDSSDSNDNQSKSLLELCILTGMHKSRDLHNSRKQQLLGGRSKHGSNRDPAAATGSHTQSNPNLKQCEATAAPSLHTKQLQQQQLQQQQQQQQQQQHTPNPRHLRDRERKDEKLLLECINTGITKKIGGGATFAGVDSASKSHTEQHFFAANAVSKNVPATSAAVLADFRPMAAITSSSAQRTAAPDVEKNKDTISHTHTHINISTACSENASMFAITSINTHSNSSSISTSPGDITSVQRRLPPPRVSNSTAASLALQLGAANPQSPANAPEMATSATGCREFDSDVSQSLSLENITSDESNQSFIMETTVSLEQTQRAATTMSCAAADKHKDPDLMLKSVERLTMEFVTSAEQLRTNGSNESTHNDSHKRLGSISVGGSNSNNTWNEDTCPNDVSFPSVSVTAPVVASLIDDDDLDDEEDEQVTEADHKELHDFAEITPTNEEQPPPSLGYTGDEVDVYGNTQPNSLETETETETLIRNEHSSYTATTESGLAATMSSSSSSGINFKLGGEVQSAAAAAASIANNHLYFQNSAMTHSTIIAIEALALADNLNLQQRGDLEDDNTELMYSLSSLDLDNIRPPSGMESLNISGYYQDLSNGLVGSQPHSLPQRSNHSHNNYMPQSPQLLCSKSPKFPRKSLPPGLMARRALGQLPAHLAGSAESINSSCNLLDNIKPPSLMDELLDSMISVASIQSEVADCESLATTVSASNYETAAAGGVNEFDDNTVTLQSCYDNTLPHDDDEDGDGDGEGTPLPSDCDFSSAESTPRKSQTGAPHGIKRTLTPKQKRKAAKDRFKTYTIAADMVLSAEQRRQLEEAQQDETLQIEIFETAAAAAASSQLPNSTSPHSQTGRSSSSSRRRTSQDRYRTQTIVYAAACSPENATAAVEEPATALSSLTSTDDCPSDDVSSIRAMTRQFKFISTPQTSSNGNLVLPVVADDYTSLERDQNSETESCHGPLSEPENDAIDEDVAAAPLEINANQPVSQTNARARIAKPNEPPNCAINEPEDVAKAAAIRGRKKPAYVSPYSMQYQRGSGAAVSRLTTNKSLTPANGVSNVPFRQRNGMNCNSPAATKGAKQKKATEVPAPLERQGTFVQDEPTVIAAHVPVVEATPPSSAQSSPTKRTSKLPTKQRAATAAAKPAATATTRKLPTNTNSTKLQRRPAPTTAAAAPQRSNSNATIRVTTNAARIAVLSTRISTTTPPSRSNSNLGAGGQQHTTVAASKISQAQSRIAGIWKRVDEASHKQHKTVGAAGGKKTSPAKGAPNKQQIVRSTTFDNEPVTSANAAATKAASATSLAATTPPTAAAAVKMANHRHIFAPTRSREPLAARK